MHHMMGHAATVALFSAPCVAPIALCSISLDVSFGCRLCKTEIALQTVHGKARECIRKATADMHHRIGQTATVALFSDPCVAPRALCSIAFDVSFGCRLCKTEIVHSCVRTMQASKSNGCTQKGETAQEKECITQMTTAAHQITRHTYTPAIFACSCVVPTAPSSVSFIVFFFQRACRTSRPQGCAKNCANEPNHAPAQTSTVLAFCSPSGAPTALCSVSFAVPFGRGLCTRESSHKCIQENVEVSRNNGHMHGEPPKQPIEAKYYETNNC